jgi:hemoglobin
VLWKRRQVLLGALLHRFKGQRHGHSALTLAPSSSRLCAIHRKDCQQRIGSLIPQFYARVRADALICPLFAGAIDDWPPHLEKLMAFWSSVMLTSGRYYGNPMAADMKHLAIIKPPMFDRWLALWSEVTSELLPVETAEALQDKAERFAQSLKLALYFHLPPRGAIISTAALGA